MNNEDEINKKPLDTSDSAAEKQKPPVADEAKVIDDSEYNPYAEISNAVEEAKKEATVSEFSPDVSIVYPNAADEKNDKTETVDVVDNGDDDRAIEAPDFYSEWDI